MEFIEIKTLSGKQVLVNIDKIESILVDNPLHVTLISEHNKYMLDESLDSVLNKINNPKDISTI